MDNSLTDKYQFRNETKTQTERANRTDKQQLIHQH